MSSCGMEQVFSQLKDVCDKFNRNNLEDMTEIQFFLQCDGGLQEFIDTGHHFMFREEVDMNMREGTIDCDKSTKIIIMILRRKSCTVLTKRIGQFVQCWALIPVGELFFL